MIGLTDYMTERAAASGAWEALQRAAEVFLALGDVGAAKTCMRLAEEYQAKVEKLKATEDQHD